MANSWNNIKKNKSTSLFLWNPSLTHPWQANWYIIQIFITFTIFFGYFQRHVFMSLSSLLFLVLHHFWIPISSLIQKVFHTFRNFFQLVSLFFLLIIFKSNWSYAILPSLVNPHCVKLFLSLEVQYLKGLLQTCFVPSLYYLFLSYFIHCFFPIQVTIHKHKQNIGFVTGCY